MPTILIRIICLLGGYAFGLIETGVIYGKIKGVDLKQHGSGNIGTTNALRVLGKKAGLVVFIGDFLKAFIPCLVVRLILKEAMPDTFLLYVFYAGVGAVLGHNFPFYLGFKGGKGVATSAGTIVGLLHPIMIIVLLVLFVATVAVTRYVSVGSIMLMVEFAILYIIFAINHMLCYDFTVPASKACGIESIIVVLLFAALCIYRHKANIVRLMKGEENKLFKTKAEKAAEAAASGDNN